MPPVTMCFRSGLQCRRRPLRDTDLVGRVGGEDAALLPCAMDEALVAAERVREVLEASGVAD